MIEALFNVDDNWLVEKRCFLKGIIERINATYETIDVKIPKRLLNEVWIQVKLFLRNLSILWKNYVDSSTIAISAEKMLTKI